VRLHFQERPWDLYVAVGYTAVMAAVLLAAGVGNLLAILLVLFVPGYVLVAALFPSGKEIDWIERIALSFGLSLAIIPLLALALNYTPFGIRFGSLLGAVVLFTFLVSLAAYRRRMRLPMEERPSLTLGLSKPPWATYSPLDKALTIALAASIALAAGTIAYVIVAPRPTSPFTEFLVLGPGGNASGYPKVLNVSEPGTVLLRIVNHEAVTTSYTIRVDLVGVAIVYNATGGFNETMETNRSTMAWLNVTLADGEDWTGEYTFRIDTFGLWKVQFLLFRDGDLGHVYRSLQFFVTVGFTRSSQVALGGPTEVCLLPGGQMEQSRRRV